MGFRSCSEEATRRTHTVGEHQDARVRAEEDPAGSQAKSRLRSRRRPGSGGQPDDGKKYVTLAHRWAGVRSLQDCDRDPRRGVPDRRHAKRLFDDRRHRGDSARPRPSGAAPGQPVLRDRQTPLDQQRYRKGAFFPYDLQTLRHRPTWAEWQLYDRSTSEGARTAVDNWLRYGERLSFLVNLFRSRQQVTSLYDTPRSTPSATPPRPAALGPALEHLSDVTKERLANSFRGSS